MTSGFTGFLLLLRCNQFVHTARSSSVVSPRMGGKIVFSGICCLDIVSYLQNGFPVEDSDLRDVPQLFTLGGNAVLGRELVGDESSKSAYRAEVTTVWHFQTNSAKVAAQLNSHSLLFSAIPRGNVLFDNLFAQYNVDTSLCIVRSAEEDAKGVPMTVVLVNERNGSRTMFSSLSNKWWPSAHHFRAQFPTLDAYGWFHFETADTLNLDEVSQCIRHVHSLNENSATADQQEAFISIELEQPVDEQWLCSISAVADVFIVAKDFALLYGWQTMRECVQKFPAKFNAHHALIVCPWGEKGAAAKCGTSPKLATKLSVFEQNAHFPSTGAVVDTLAAGDCFIAGLVHFLNERHTVEEALKKAVVLAGESVGQRGLAGLKLPQ